MKKILGEKPSRESVENSQGTGYRKMPIVEMGTDNVVEYKKKLFKKGLEYVGARIKEHIDKIKEVESWIKEGKIMESKGKEIIERLQGEIDKLNEEKEERLENESKYTTGYETRPLSEQEKEENIVEYLIAVKIEEKKYKDAIAEAEKEGNPVRRVELEGKLKELQRNVKKYKELHADEIAKVKAKKN